jgi:hypothetical protein
MSSVMKFIREIETFSSTGPQCISIWPPLVARHTSRRYSVSRKELSTIVMKVMNRKEAVLNYSESLIKLHGVTEGKHKNFKNGGRL